MYETTGTWSSREILYLSSLDALLLLILFELSAMQQFTLKTQFLFGPPWKVLFTVYISSGRISSCVLHRKWYFPWIYPLKSTISHELHCLICVKVEGLRTVFEERITLYPTSPKSVKIQVEDVSGERGKGSVTLDGLGEKYATASKRGFSEGMRRWRSLPSRITSFAWTLSSTRSLST